MDAVATAETRSALRLQRLIEANRLIVAELALDQLLRRVVESAREIVGAQFAALVVQGADGSVERFLHCGMDDSTVAAIGALPEGRGLLGVCDEEPVRVRSVSEDPRSCGLPAGHPPLKAFLGVPIRSASSVYGNLYFTNPTDGEEFTEEDVDLVRALAATASIAIENARLYDEAGQRHEWLRVSSEVSHRLLAEECDLQTTLEELAEAARRLARADSVMVIRPVDEDPDVLEIAFVEGDGVEDLLGLRYNVAGSVAWQAMQEQRGLVVHDLRERLANTDMPVPASANHAMVFPLQGSASTRGAIVLGRSAHGPFTSADLQMAEGFAAQAAMAMEIAESREDRQRVAVLEDRARIARELNDHVVQRLFAAGLTVQGAASMAPDAVMRSQLTSTVSSLDETIRSIRTSIFDLREETQAAASLRTRALAVVIELSNALGQVPAVQVDESLETLMADELASDVEAVLRAVLTDLARNPAPTPVTLELGSDGVELAVTIVDHGTGPGRLPRRSALTDLHRRAERHGGTVTLGVAEGGGMRLHWTAALP